MQTVLREHRDQVVWLSGASSGIGFALAELLLQKGFRLALTSRREDPLQLLANQAGAERVLLLPADVTDRHALATAYEHLRSTWQIPDLVLANAGISLHMEAESLDYEKLRRIQEVNLLGAISMLQLPLQDMLQRGSGHLAGVASLAGYRGLPHAAGYVSSKAGLIAFLDSLRFDVQPYGLAVSVINPGFVRTPMTNRNHFPMPFLVSPERSAQYIWNGLKKGRMEIHYPPAFSFLLKALRGLPYPLYHTLIQQGIKGQHHGKDDE